jgi:hypothetical protein
MGEKRMYTHTQKREEQCKFKHQDINIELNFISPIKQLHVITRGSVGWACVAHLSFCFEET